MPLEAFQWILKRFLVWRGKSAYSHCSRSCSTFNGGCCMWFLSSSFRFLNHIRISIVINCGFWYIAWSFLHVAMVSLLSHAPCSNINWENILFEKFPTRTLFKQPANIDSLFSLFLVAKMFFNYRKKYREPQVRQRRHKNVVETNFDTFEVFIDEKRFISRPNDWRRLFLWNFLSFLLIIVSTAYL